MLETGRAILTAIILMGAQPLAAEVAATAETQKSPIPISSPRSDGRCVSEDGLVMLMYSKDKGIEGGFFAVRGGSDTIYFSHNRPNPNWPNRPTAHGLRYSQQSQFAEYFTYVTRLSFTLETVSSELRDLINRGHFNQNFNCTFRQYEGRGLE